MEGKGGREAATEGRTPTALRVAGGHDVEVVHRVMADRGRAARGRYLPRSATPPIRARHYRAKIGGAADPATSPVSAPVVTTSPLSPRHGN